MKKRNVSEVRNNFSKTLRWVARGETVILLKRNVPFAQILPLDTPQKNLTQLGCGKGTGKVLCDPTEPFISPDEWSILRDS